MEDKLSKLEESTFGDNRYYVEIIKSFIEGYPLDSTRVFIDNDRVELKVNDLVGTKMITFKETSDGKLKINIDRNVDLVRYQDVLIYDDHGVMMERSSCMAILQKDVNKKVESTDLALELNNLGENLSGRASEIYQSINMKKVTRPENFGLEGNYIEKRVVYGKDGNPNQNLIQGKFNVLNSSSISSLEFPNEENILLTNSENFIQKDTYEYPNSRSL